MYFQPKSSNVMIIIPFNIKHYKLFSCWNTVSLWNPSADHPLTKFHCIWRLSHQANEPFKQWRHECHHPALSVSESLSTLFPPFPGLKEFIRRTPVPTWFICLQKKFTCIPTKKKRQKKRSKEMRKRGNFQWNEGENEVAMKTVKVLCKENEGSIVHKH